MHCHASAPSSRPPRPRTRPALWRSCRRPSWCVAGHASPSVTHSLLQISFQNEKAAIVADYEQQVQKLRVCKQRLKDEHAAALAALRAELEAAMAKALADLEERLKAAHAKEIEALLADAAAKLAAALDAMRADYEAQLAALRAQAERDAAELARLRAENSRLKTEADEADAMGIYYQKASRDAVLCSCRGLTLLFLSRCKWTWRRRCSCPWARSSPAWRRSSGT